MLAQHLTISPSTVPLWVDQGIIPKPRERGGKLLWKWAEVDERLTNGAGPDPDPEAERIRNGTRRLATEARDRH